MLKIYFYSDINMFSRRSTSKHDKLNDNLISTDTSIGADVDDDMNILYKQLCIEILTNEYMKYLRDITVKTIILFHIQKGLNHVNVSKYGTAVKINHGDKLYIVYDGSYMLQDGLRLTDSYIIIDESDCLSRWKKQDNIAGHPLCKTNVKSDLPTVVHNTYDTFPVSTTRIRFAFSHNDMLKVNATYEEALRTYNFIPFNTCPEYKLIKVDNKEKILAEYKDIKVEWLVQALSNPSTMKSLFVSDSTGHIRFNVGLYFAVELLIRKFVEAGVAWYKNQSAETLRVGRDTFNVLPGGDKSYIPGSDLKITMRVQVPVQQVSSQQVSLQQVSSQPLNEV
jgi:hypothetical protein